jgi:hypothetical protein
LKLTGVHDIFNTGLFSVYDSLVIKEENMRRVSTIAIFAVLLASAGMANILTNGSFETASGGNTLPTGNGAELAIGSTAMLGWTVYTTESSPSSNFNVAWLPTGNVYGITPEDGSYSLDLTGYNDVSPYSGVEQSVTTTIGTNYTLTFWVGEYQSNSIYSGPVSVYASAGNQSAVVFTTTVPNGSTGNVWQQETLNFTATSTTTTVAISGDTTAGGQYIGLDNVNLALASTGVPEPATALPVFLAAAGFLAYARRKARRTEAR